MSDKSVYTKPKSITYGFLTGNSFNKPFKHYNTHKNTMLNNMIRRNLKNTKDELSTEPNNIHILFSLSDVISEIKIHKPQKSYQTSLMFIPNSLQTNYRIAMAAPVFLHNSQKNHRHGNIYHGFAFITRLVLNKLGIFISKFLKISVRTKRNNGFITFLPANPYIDQNFGSASAGMLSSKNFKSSILSSYVGNITLMPDNTKKNASINRSVFGILSMAKLLAKRFRNTS